jgi:hypothetical protein
MMLRDPEYLEAPWARTAGLFYAGTIAGGVFSAFFVRGAIVVHGDAVATIHNMLAMEPLWRAGIAAEAVGTLCYVAVTAILYDMLKPVSRRLSVLAACFSLVGCAMGMMNLANDLAPLALLKDAPFMGAFTVQQVHALAYAFLRLGGAANGVALLCFGIYCALIGLLVFRSDFMPKAVGAILAVAGACWMVSSFAGILSPPVAALLMPLQFAGIAGEAVLTLWLVTRGVDVPRWQDAAASAIPLGRI